jgi:NADH-quinone oxidoreductase subunit N
MIDIATIRWELFVGVTILGLLCLDLFTAQSKRYLAFAGAGILATCLVWSLFVDSSLPIPTSQSTKGARCVLDAYALWGKQFFLFATILSILMTIKFSRGNQEHLVENVILQLCACLGMMFLASAKDFVSLFISLELMTVSFYILVSFQKRELPSIEAGLKYLVMGALSSGIMLYGIALIVGTTSEIQFSSVGTYLVKHPQTLLPKLGLILLLVGLAFKISAVPFHWWTPDVYEGAPTPTVALLSTGSKAAGFIILARVLFEAFPSYRSVWFPLLCFGAGGSILVGNLGALSQSNLKRLMGYSSISHTGYLLLGLAAIGASGGSLNEDSSSLSAMLYYLLGYLLANGLVFLIMSETSYENPRQEIRGYSGLASQSSSMAVAITLGLLSLAGIPPLAGFFGKLLLLKAAFSHELLVLVGIAVVGVVCSFYYYLGIIRTIYFVDQVEPSQTYSKLFLTRGLRVFLMVSVIVVGFYQTPWLQASLDAARVLFLP